VQCFQYYEVFFSETAVQLPHTSNALNPPHGLTMTMHYAIIC